MAQFPDLTKIEEDQFDIRIDRNGTWFHAGRPIERMALVKLFSTVLHYNPDTGEYWLITPYEKGRVDVEDVPYVITNFEWDADSKTLSLVTNLDVVVQPSIAREITLEGAQGIPYIPVKNNVKARMNRSVREALINIALTQNGYDTATGILFSNANGGMHVIARD